MRVYQPQVSQGTSLPTSRRSLQTCGCLNNSCKIKGCVRSKQQLIHVPSNHPTGEGALPEPCSQPNPCCSNVTGSAELPEQPSLPAFPHLLASLVALMVTLWPAPSLGLPSADVAQQAPPAQSSSDAVSTQSAGPETAGAAAASLNTPAPNTADAPQYAVPVPPEKYVPSPIELGWEVYVGFLAGIIPFAIGSWEFGKRIIIQRRCALCRGKGLVPSARTGTKYLRKCPECGGFFPWISWKMFLTSTAAPGNGGPLLQPKGQTSVLYSVPDNPTPEQIAETQARYMGKEQQQEQGPKEGQ